MANTVNRHEGGQKFKTIRVTNLDGKAITGEDATSTNGKGGLTVLYRRAVGHSSAAANSLVKMESKSRIIDVWTRKIAAGSASTESPTIQLQTSTGGAISDAMAINKAAGAITRATNLSTANDVVAAGAEVRLRKAQAGTTGPSANKSHAYEAYILAVRTT